MLAFRYNDRKKHLLFPCHIQPKLNGIRMLYQDGSMQSRSHGKDTELLWAANRLQRLRHGLRNVHPSIILDGELYRHGWSLQKINSAASIGALEDKESTDELEYHVFDCYLCDRPNATFAERWGHITWMYLFDSCFCTVDTQVALTEEVAEPFYQKWRSDGYEGMMYRQFSAPYGTSDKCSNKENRWNCLLKRKEWLDDEFECTDFNVTEGKKGERGFQLTCRLGNGKTFNVGSGLSDGEVLLYELNPPIGQMITVKYEMLSDDGVPLKPSILEVQ